LSNKTAGLLPSGGDGLFGTRAQLSPDIPLDPYPQSVSESHFPRVPPVVDLGSVRTVSQSVDMFVTASVHHALLLCCAEGFGVNLCIWIT